MRRSSKQIGFVKHYVEFTNCAVQATKLEWKSQSTSEIFANSISQIPRALANANQRLRFLRRQLTKKRPGTVVCGYRKIPATDRLTGFATAAPRTPERAQYQYRMKIRKAKKLLQNHRLRYENLQRLAQTCKLRRYSYTSYRQNCCRSVNCTTAPK